MSHTATPTKALPPFAAKKSGLYSQVLIAAAHKGEGVRLLADSVGHAAYDYACNPGAWNTVSGIMEKMKVSESGKARTPAPNTSAALILSAMLAICHGRTEGKPLETWPTNKGGRVFSDDPIEDKVQRSNACIAFALKVQADYVASVDAATAAKQALADANRAKREAAKAEAEALTSSNKADHGASGEAVEDIGSNATPADVSRISAKALLILAGLTDDELSALANESPELARKVSTVMGGAVAIAGFRLSEPVQAIAPAQGDTVAPLALTADAAPKRKKAKREAVPA